MYAALVQHKRLQKSFNPGMGCRITIHKVDVTGVRAYSEDRAVRAVRVILDRGLMFTYRILLWASLPVLAVRADILRPVLQCMMEKTANHYLPPSVGRFVQGVSGR